MSTLKSNTRKAYDDCNYKQHLETTASLNIYRMYGGAVMNCNNCAEDKDVCGSDKMMRNNLINNHVKRLALEDELRFGSTKCGCTTVTKLEDIRVDKALVTPHDMCSIVPSREKLLKW